MRSFFTSFCNDLIQASVSKSLQQADQITEKELMFTSPISISKQDFEKVREQIVMFLKGFSKVVKDSPAEEIACLNIDLFWIQK